MNIFITGANGFVGQTLCKTLSNNGEYVIASIRNSNMNIQANKVIVSQLDTNTDFTNILQITDVIVHLAARTHVLNDQSTNPYQTYAAINIDATKNLATQAISAGVKRFIFLSSVKVNGEQTNEKPFNELDIAKPEDNYGKTKHLAEEMLKELTQYTSMELVIIRPPLVYGHGVKANFDKLIRLCKISIPLPFGTISNQRSIIYIENLIDFIVSCVRHPLAANQTFLISDDDDVSTTQLIRSIRQVLGKPLLLIPVPQKWLVGILNLRGKKSLAIRLCGNLQVDIGKAKLLLGWKPPYTFSEGIHKTIHKH